jgi:hypothetical protein
MDYMKLSKVALLLVMTLALLPSSLFANITHAPSNFSSSEGFAVFTDFQEATYNITYDSASKSVKAISKITFTTTEIGMPIFDLLENPTLIILDGEKVQNKMIQSPDGDTKFRLILKSLKPGLHSVEISSPITAGIKFLEDGVSSAFWFSDLDDRSYLETYLPANYEYDQYKIIFNLDFKNSIKQRIYSNGKVSKLSDSQFSIEFPNTYTSSSVYFHTSPVGRFSELTFNFHSIDGRDIPAVVYSLKKSGLEDFKKQTLLTLKTLESQYGAFLHQSVTIFDPGTVGGGGMEYCGATATSLWALNHELTHSYFARGGFMPANGNSGWIDEAITTWSDEGSKSKSELGSMTSNMAGHSEWRRFTDDNAYTKGRDLMANLHYKFQANGGLKSFLNQLIQNNSFKPMTTEEFILQISNFYSEDLTPLFKKHVYSTKRNKTAKNTNQYHMKLSVKEMESFL